MISYDSNLFANHSSLGLVFRCTLWQVKWKPGRISSPYERSQAFTQSKKTYFFLSSFWATDRWKKKKRKKKNWAVIWRLLRGFPLSKVNHAQVAVAVGVDFECIYGRQNNNILGFIKLYSKHIRWHSVGCSIIWLWFSTKVLCFKHAWNS